MSYIVGMNRQERRAAKARIGKERLDPIVAVHEAGHALGRYVTAEVLGFVPSEAICSIEVGVLNPFFASDGTLYAASATTYGPMFSRPMVDYLNLTGGDLSVSHEALAREVRRCKSVGIDVACWAKAKAVTCMAGPVAEALHSRRNLVSVLQSPECASDIKDLQRDCSLAELSTSETASALSRAVELSHRLLTRKDIWRALQVLAVRLPKSGTMDGTEAAGIIAGVLSGANVQLTTAELIEPPLVQ